jgi:hypothetical protein
MLPSPTQPLQPPHTHTVRSAYPCCRRARAVVVSAVGRRPRTAVVSAATLTMESFEDSDSIGSTFSIPQQTDHDFEP